MRIIYGHDYYDSVLAYGQDDTITLVRQKSNILIDDQAHKIPKLYRNYGVSLLAKHPSWKTPSDGGWEIMDYERNCRDTKIIARPCKVWVAGSEWNGVCLDINTITDIKRKYAWTWQSLVSCGNSIGIEFPTNHKNSFDTKRSYVRPDWFGEKQSHNDLVSWMVSNQVSIVTVEPANSRAWYAKPIWRINGDNLKNIEFYKAVDAFTMFQKISQWVGGVLPNTATPMVEINNDLIKAHKHGFDRWSFRKQPQNKN
jgi:hypothetical protein